MKLELYILRQLLVSFLFAVAGILFIALPGIAVTAVHKMPLADAVVILRYVPVVLETLAPYVLPICFLLSVVATYGRLAADLEWTAIQMAGFQPLRMLRPALALALVLSTSTYWMMANELPRAKARQRAALVDAAASSLKNLQPGRTTLNFHKFFLKATYRDPDNQDVLHDVHIRKPDEETGDSLVDIFADKVHIRMEGEDLLIDLFNATFVSAESQKAYSERMSIAYPKSKLVGEERGTSNRAGHRTNAEILDELAAGQADEVRARKLHLELHSRRSLAMTFLVFLGLGAPTGLVLRRGTQLGALAVAVGFGLVYYICSMRIGKELGEAGAVPAWAAMWTTPVIGLLISLPLLRKGMKR